MKSPNPHRLSTRSSATFITGTDVVLSAGILLSPTQASPASREPVLVGRAVLPALTFAGLPASCAFVVPGAGTLNGVSFPLPGYEDLVTALAEPDKPDHTHLVEWYVEVYGGSPADFDPAHVEVEALDQAVRLVAG